MHSCMYAYIHADFLVYFKVCFKVHKIRSLFSMSIPVLLNLSLEHVQYYYILCIYPIILLYYEIEYECCNCLFTCTLYRSRSPPHHSRSRYHRSRSSSSDNSSSNSSRTPSPVKKRPAKPPTSERKDSSSKKPAGTKVSYTATVGLCNCHHLCIKCIMVYYLYIVQHLIDIYLII